MVKELSPFAQEKEPGSQPGCGVLLPTYTPRIRPFLKGVAAFTVFAFTFTSVLPAGWAWPTHDQETLRPKQFNEANQKEKSDLKNALAPKPAALGQKPNPRAPSLITALLGIHSLGQANGSAALKNNPNLWDKRAASGLEEAPPSTGPKVTRRAALKAGAGVVAAGALVGVGAAQNAQAPGQQPQIPDRVTDYDTGLGFTLDENTVTIDFQGGTFSPPVPKKLQEARGLRAAKAIQRAFADQWEKWLTGFGQLVEKIFGWSEKVPPNPAEAWVDVDKSGKFGDNVSLRSYVVWAPWLAPKELWPWIFARMRAVAGVGPNEKTDQPHSRIYCDPYGAISPYRPWSIQGMAEFIQKGSRLEKLSWLAVQKTARRFMPS